MRPPFIILSALIPTDFEQQQQQKMQTVGTSFLGQPLSFTFHFRRGAYQPLQQQIAPIVTVYDLLIHESADGSKFTSPNVPIYRIRKRERWRSSGSAEDMEPHEVSSTAENHSIIMLQVDSVRKRKEVVFRSIKCRCGKKETQQPTAKVAPKGNENNIIPTFLYPTLWKELGVGCVRPRRKEAYGSPPTNPILLPGGCNCIVFLRSRHERNGVRAAHGSGFSLSRFELNDFL
ncbi:arginyl-tRNA synthetase [Anopheles sinensis]|uniref:Arginyl-tRNA synthetase n=1 Tax=Anopheles sinensis TaxID=74873 RepID=A0A084WGC4_ANOSI|nr:arginyl-tRNA synthetase [Anopheles sinensis]